MSEKAKSLCLSAKENKKSRLTFAVSRDLLSALTTSSWCAISLMFLGRLECWERLREVEVEVEFFLFDFFFDAIAQTSFFVCLSSRSRLLSLPRFLGFFRSILMR